MSKKTMLTACFALTLLGVIGGLLYAAISGDANVAVGTIIIGAFFIVQLIEERQDLDDE